MLDSETLRPVIIAMTLYLVLSHLAPRVIKKPTGIKPVDDVIMLLISQSGSLMPGSILIGLLVFAANYINAELI